MVETHFTDFCNILIDLPGHGKSQLSESNDYLRLLDSLMDKVTMAGFERIIPIGYSMGGRLAFHLRERYSDHIPGMVLISSTPGLKTRTDRQQRRIADTELMNKLDQTGIETFVKEWYKLPLFHSIQQDQKLLDSLHKSRLMNKPFQLRRAIDLLGNGALPSLWENLPEWQLPILLLSGSEDAKYCEINQELAVLLPRCEHAIIEGGDHAFHLEKPLETALLIRHFLRESIEGV